MQKVDDYLRRSKRARDDAQHATSKQLKKTLERLGKEWSRLAEERLEVLELRLRRNKIEE